MDDVESLSKECQTEWDWKEDLETMKKLYSARTKKRNTKRSFGEKSINQTLYDSDIKKDNASKQAKSVSPVTEKVTKTRVSNTVQHNNPASNVNVDESEIIAVFPNNVENVSNYHRGFGPPEILKVHKQDIERDIKSLSSLGFAPDFDRQGSEFQMFRPGSVYHLEGSQLLSSELQSYIHQLDAAFRAVISHSGGGVAHCPFCGSTITLELSCCSAFKEFSKLAGFESFNGQIIHETETTRGSFLKKLGLEEHSKKVEGENVMSPKEEKRGRKQRMAKERRKSRGKEHRRSPDSKDVANKARLERRRAARENMRSLMDRQTTSSSQMTSATQHGATRSRTTTNISYQLSSEKCRKWMVSPRTTFQLDPQEMRSSTDFYELSEFGNEASPGRLVTRHYQNGNLFLIVFPDGSGNVFHPSGRVAVTVVTVGKDLYTYVLQDDTSNAQIMGVFQPTGHAVIYHANQRIRICLNQAGGLEMDEDGSKKRKWQWQETSTADRCSLMSCPITCAILPGCAARIMSRDNVSLTYDAECRRCRFSVGARVKKLTKPARTDMNEVATQ